MMMAVLPPTHALPRLDELVGPWTIASWLASRYSELALSNKLYQRYAAMGLAANRFIPDDPKELTLYVDGHYSDELEEQVSVWLMSQPPEDIKSVAQEAELEALNLVAEFDMLAAKKWPMEDLLLLALAREILECVVVVLQRRGYASKVKPTLEILDAQALKRIPFRALPPPSFRPQILLAVRGLTPKKWWGRILGPMS